MKKILLSVALAATFAAGSAQAANFVNGGFENGTTSSWTEGSGRWNSTDYADLTSANYSPGGPLFSAAFAAVTVTTLGTTDTYSGLSTVRYGNNAVRVNNDNNNNSVNLIKQTVLNYDAATINFSWAAVLQDSHGITDSDNFTITLRDDTAGSIVTTINYNSATSSTLFTNNGGVYTTAWIDEIINVTQGHDYTLTLLAADCPYGGHWGYVYLDGFGSVIGGGGGNGNNVPEPGSLALLGLGLAGLAASRRRKA